MCSEKIKIRRNHVIGFAFRNIEKYLKGWKTTAMKLKYFWDETVYFEMQHSKIHFFFLSFFIWQYLNIYVILING